MIPLSGTRKICVHKGISIKASRVFRVPILSHRAQSFRERNTSISHQGTQEKQMSFVICRIYPKADLLHCPTSSCHLKKKLQSSLSEESFGEALSCVLVVHVIVKPQGNETDKALPFHLSYRSMM
ncbi:hypothetical protein K443DRAFT_595377 [Laccaria amethystina LaAM-08-1]|uniref:Uncharacterized protein n=1 Tax=Laccaria amethystina LaAM-08-1 TaxID=1095629 RepID=A0A0C9XST9_9AGAR|nr:hypothetical protein K443DRAFT_595377 [Laccaria amethystina LaAM-08-1]